MKKNEIDLLNESFYKEGYGLIKSESNEPKYLYAKKIKPDYFITFGLEKSTLYDKVYNGSFYFSKHLTWNLMLPDFPVECSSRVSQFLTAEEQREVMKDPFNIRWWDFEGDGLSKFIVAVFIVEKRFLSQSDLFSKIDSWGSLNEYMKLLKLIIDSIDFDLNDPYFIVSYDIPMDWSDKVKAVLELNGIKFNKNLLKRYAYDTYRLISFNR